MVTVRTPSSARPRLLAVVAGLVLALIILLGIGSGLYTDLLFFREVKYSSVFTTVLGTKALLFVLFGIAMAVIIGANVTVAYLVRPPFRPLSPEQQSLERYRVALEPHLIPLLVVVAGFFGLLAGSSASGRWRTWQLWMHGQPFGVKDPQFHRDISYYAFSYPFQRFVLGFFFTATVLSLLTALVTHYLFGGIRLQTQGEKVVAAARAHISVLLGVFVLLKAVAYYLDRFGLAFSPRGVVTGASYTDVHAVLPAKTILLVVAVLCAVLFFANIGLRGWQLPSVAFGLLVLSALVIGGIYPAIVQQFRVKPNELNREAPFIQRNIEATRTAYGLTGVQTTDYPGVSTAQASALRNDTSTIPFTRLLDPAVLGRTFEQLQQVRNYYGFPGTLDIDRYAVDGKTQDYVVAVRELDQGGLSDSQRNWINLHLAYTHGNGFVSAPANTVDAAGRPAFSEKDIPVTGPLTIDQPRVYYGEKAPSYSVVGTSQPEIDGPGGAGGGDQATNTYDGKGGVVMGGPLRRLAFALKFREKNLLLSGAIKSQSRIMYVRNPRERVHKVAPYLELDGDPYPAVVDGRIQWIMDGYTTSDGFPYSERRTLGDVTADTLTQTAGSGRLGQPRDQVNYIRNSVKATVDAYDGTVKLYAFDESDPVLRTWMKVFPGTVLPASEITPSLRAHFRYPEDFFKVQRDLLAQYHVPDAKGFYSKEDFWAVPDDPTAGSGESQPPFYIYAQPPGYERAGFTLTSTYVALRRPNLTAFVSVSSDPANYGQLRVLRLPKSSVVNGVGQVQANFKTDPRISRDFTLFNQQGSQVVLGNLLTLPVQGGLLYVEPLYVASTSGESFPALRKVLVSFGDKIGYQDTLPEALDEVFGPGAGANAPTPGGGTPSGGTSSGGTGGTGTGTGAATGGASAALAADIAAANQAFKDGQAAFGKGDFAGYAAAQQRLKDALSRAAADSAAAKGAGGGAKGGASPKPTPSPGRPAPSPSASP